MAFGLSGFPNLFRLTYERRKIVVAQGIDFRDNDVKERQKKGYGDKTLVEFMQSHFSSNFTLIDQRHMEYVSDEQFVIYNIEVIYSKDEFKTALNTPGIHVIYQGHSRYGRGSCFDPDAPSTNYTTGDRWEHGTSIRNGLYRLGYPYVPVPLADIEHHQYHFAPVPAEASPPPYHKRHPDARRWLYRVHLPESLKGFVAPGFESTTDHYWGCTVDGQRGILLVAGWEETTNAPYDLGATDIQCKVFCHFGCSSRLHYWKIVRDGHYKDWRRDVPPTDRFAYFTTNPADYRGYCFWLTSLLKYPEANNYQSWWHSLEYAKRHANRLLRSHRAYFQIY